MNEADKTSVSNNSFIQFAEEISNPDKTYDDWKKIQYLAADQKEAVEVAKFKDWLMQRKCDEVQSALTRRPLELLAKDITEIDMNLPYTISEILDMAKARTLPPVLCVKFFKVMQKDN